MSSKTPIGDINWELNIFNDPAKVGTSVLPPKVITTQQDLLNTYGQPGDYLTLQTSDDIYKSVYQTLNTYKWTYQIPDVQVPDSNVNVKVQMDNGEEEVITRDELVKYLSERKLVRENELVRKVYDRYQVAVKLARSDDDGNTGV